MPSLPKQPPAYAAAIVCAVFFLSGTSALILEISWTRQLELLLGNSVHAATTMIAVYMLGLGIGSLFGRKLARRKTAPLKIYAVLEVLIIAWALAVPFLLNLLNILFPLIASVPGLHSPAGTPTILRLLASIVIFAAPTLFMGATLPVLTHAVAARASGFATRFSFLYGTNTLGAVAGALSAGFILLPRFGVSKTVFAALSLNLAAAILAVLLTRLAAFRNAPSAEESLPTSGPILDSSSSSSSSPGFLAAFAAASGFLALFLEVYWFRTLVLVFGSTTYSLSAMLGIFLAGTALGPILLGWIGDRSKSVRNLATVVGFCFFGAGIAIVFSLNSIGNLPDRLLEQLATNNLSWRQLITSKFVVSAQIVLLPALFLSAVLPLCAKALRANTASASAAARVYVANTFGATTGILLGGFIFLPTFGLYAGLLGGGIACIVIALISITFIGRAPRLGLILPVATVFLGLVWFVFREPWDKKKFALGAYFHPGAHSESGRIRFDDVLRTSQLQLYREGVATTVAVLKSHDGNLRYTSNGKVEADTSTRSMINQRLIGHLPMLLHPGEPKTVINIGLGAGVTLGALGRHPEVQSLHVVEIEPAAVLVADAFAAWNHDVIRHPALSLYYNDARNFLRTTHNKYDVITSDPFEPAAAGSIHLFTREHFLLVKSRLANDGILCQWLPMSELSLQDYSALVGTFVSVFPQTLYFSTGADSALLGFNDRVRVDPEEVNRRLLDPQVAESLKETGFTKPEHFWGMLIADLSTNPPRPPARLITDDLSFVEFSGPHTVLQQTHFRNRQHQINVFESGRRDDSDTKFFSTFPEDQRKQIRKNQLAIQTALRAGFEYASGNIQLAADAAAEAVYQAPDNPLVLHEVAAIYHMMGNALLKQGDADNAITLLAKAHEFQPREFKYLYRLAVALLRQGESEQALPLLVRGIRLFPDSPFFYSLQGSFLLEAGRFPQALELHKIAVEKAPRLDHLWEQYERAAQMAGNDNLVSKIKKQRRNFTE